MFYILDKHGVPLMPTTRYRHIKKLIGEGKAIKISGVPFVVQLLYDTPGKTQPLVLGIDPGRSNIGLSVITEAARPLFEAKVETRNKEIPKLMEQRKGFRHQKHRGYGRRKKKLRRAIAARATAKRRRR